MSATIHNLPRRLSEGAASVERLHEAWRAGSLPFAASSLQRNSMAGDPLRLDDGIPTLTDRVRRGIERHHRTAPHAHLVHRVDTETDITAGLGGVAIGGLAVPELDESYNLGGDLYEARPITRAAPQPRRHSKVDPVLRSRVWRALLALYLVAGAVIAWALLS